MKRPAWQHYPADWNNSANLGRCSWGAQGVWIRALGKFHDSDEYGVLRWPLKQIAQAVGCPQQLLRELAEKGVLKGSDKKHEAYIYTPRHAGKTGAPVTLIEAGDGPCWYSSRMVTDEYLRTTRGASTRFGYGPDPTPTRRHGGTPKPTPDTTPSQRQGDGASSSSTSSIHGVVDGNIDAGAREPHLSGNNLPLKVNGKSKPPAGWHRSPEGIDNAGRMLGIAAKRGEDYEHYKARLFEAMNGPP